MAIVNDSPARSFRALIGGIFLAVFVSFTVVLFVFTQFSREKADVATKIQVNGFDFTFSARQIRAHALKNGETQEVTVMLRYVPDVQITASLSNAPPQEGITLVLRPALDDLAPQERVAVLYPRFLAGASFAGPEGLSGRIFTPNSAYDGEVLFTSNTGFAARCAQATSTEIAEYCLRDLRLGGGKLDATIRFPRQFLSEWRELDKNILAELEKARE